MGHTTIGHTLAEYRWQSLSRAEVDAQAAPEFIFSPECTELVFMILFFSLPCRETWDLSVWWVWQKERCHPLLTPLLMGSSTDPTEYGSEGHMGLGLPVDSNPLWLLLKESHMSS